MEFDASKMTPAVASEQSIFRKNHDYNSYKKVFGVAVNTYVSLPIFCGLDARGGRKLRTDTHTRDNHSNDNIRAPETHTYNNTYAKRLNIKHVS